MNRLFVFFIFLIVVAATAVLSGQFYDAQWYQLVMKKPSWNPSIEMMAWVWVALYGLMAIAAWMVWESKQKAAYSALAWWSLNLLLNILWSWMYFGLHRIGWALGVMALWILVLLLIVRLFGQIRRSASNLMIPVAVWLLFLWALNITQWSLNGGGAGSLPFHNG